MLLGFLTTLHVPYISITVIPNLPLLFRQGSQTEAQLWLTCLWMNLMK